jgi:hypothetical protein
VPTELQFGPKRLQGFLPQSSTASALPPKIARGGTMRALPFALLLCVLCATLARADGPQDNIATAVRPIPKPGIEVPAGDRQELEAGLGSLKMAMDRLTGGSLKATTGQEKKPFPGGVPDIEIYWKAVHDALVYNEFFSPADTNKAKALLAKGLERAEQLATGKAPWTEQTGLVVRGYVSRIDGSVQPYGLVIPKSYSPQARHRLDIWFHGRGETTSEVNFIDERQRQVGTFAPADTIVLHPYGRYCNAFRFAGETDVLEALEAVKQQYRIDDDRISVRGFSMGGAACWQFAVHYADRWFAANPGAGFSETARFLNVFQKEQLKPTWYDRSFGISTIRLTTPQTCASAPPWPIAASLTSRSRPPT